MMIMDEYNIKGYYPSMRQGFSLVELSIVLVILGLLTGGILTGQSLIRASELRAITTEYQRYIAATQTFRDKYFALPGDMRNATSFWGRLNSSADCITNASAVVATPGGCDGNGNGNVDAAAAASQSGEMFQFWRHLALAGLVEGTYTGLAGAGGNADSLLGTNVPRSKISNSGWAISFLSNWGGDTASYAKDYGHFLFVGTASTGWMPGGPIFKPEEAWNIDTKMDDGRPGTGNIIAREIISWSGAAASKCTTSTSNTDFAGNYNLSGSTLGCPLYFIKAF
jgi:prepilin-type N-terminal cleavage/methylation domain-containing protein